MSEHILTKKIVPTNKVHFVDYELHCAKCEQLTTALFFETGVCQEAGLCRHCYHKDNRGFACDAAVCVANGPFKDTTKEIRMESNKRKSDPAFFTKVDFVSHFRSIQEMVHDTAIRKGWWEQERNSGECIALMHSELSEALEGLRKPHQDEHCPAFSSVEIELADCIIRIMDLAQQRGWRIAEALIAKAEYNETREIRHGGKKF